jgi:hypothetical protein
MTKSTEEKTYILDLRGGGKRRLTVPATWKLTFGPLIPGNKDGSGRGTLALRFYEGSKEHQRAVFTDVESFRDSSIEVEEQVTRVKRQGKTRNAPTGTKETVMEARITEWRNPDQTYSDDDEEFLQLGFDSEDE